MRDIVHNIGIVTAIAPAVQTGQVTGTMADILGFESIAAVVHTGAIVSAGDFSIKLQHSDTTTAGDFEDCAATDIVGTFPATLEADALVKVGYKGNRRYLRPVLSKNGGTSIAAGVIFVKGHPHDAPVA